MLRRCVAVSPLINDEPLTIYGEASRNGAARLQAEGVTFKQTFLDVKAR